MQSSKCTYVTKTLSERVNEHFVCWFVLKELFVLYYISMVP